MNDRLEEKKLTVRETARQQKSLSGTDAEALEGALSRAEREIAEKDREIARLMNKEKEPFYVDRSDECKVQWNYQVLKGPDGFECILTEPEDRTFYRDLAVVVEKLNELYKKVDQAAFESARAEIKRLRGLERRWIERTNELVMAGRIADEQVRELVDMLDEARIVSDNPEAEYNPDWLKIHRLTKELLSLLNQLELEAFGKIGGKDDNGQGQNQGNL